MSDGKANAHKVERTFDRDVSIGGRVIAAGKTVTFEAADKGEAERRAAAADRAVAAVAEANRAAAAVAGATGGAIAGAPAPAVTVTAPSAD